MFNDENSRPTFESFNFPSFASRVHRPPMWKNPALYKSRLCDSWIKGATCRFGVHCWFAHGLEELRELPFLGNDSAAKTLALAQVVQSLPARSRGKQYANAASLAFATEFAKSVAPILTAQVQQTKAPQPDSSLFSFSMPRPPHFAASRPPTVELSRSNPFAPIENFR